MNLELIRAAFGFIAFDVATGILSAIKHKELNSRVAREGMFTKAAYAMLIGFAMFAQWVPAEYGYQDFHIPSVEVVCGVIAWNETISVVENITRMLPNKTAKQVMDLFRLDTEKFQYLWYEIEDPIEPAKVQEFAKSLEESNEDA